jgi:hypothetical protein
MAIHFIYLCQTEINPNNQVATSARDIKCSEWKSTELNKYEPSAYSSDRVLKLIVLSFLCRIPIYFLALYLPQIFSTPEIRIQCVASDTACSLNFAVTETLSSVLRAFQYILQKGDQSSAKFIGSVDWMFELKGKINKPLLLEWYSIASGK